MRKYDLIIFDMDGTILDTLEDLTDSLNAALSRNKLPERDIEEVRVFVGNGIRLLIERAVPQESPVSLIDRVHRDFMAHYQAHCSDKTKPYAGIPELLCSLRERGYLTAVVSNKADSAVQELCKQYFEGLFCCAVGEQTGIRKKPAPDAVYEVMDSLGVRADRAVYVGDSEVDVATARNAKIDGIAVKWGFRSEETLRAQGAARIIAAPSELLALV